MTKSHFINPKILDSWNEGERWTVQWGGRGSGKSTDDAFLCIQHAVNNPKSRVLCVRGTQNKISESSLQTLKDVIVMLGYESAFIMTENTLKCKNGSDFLFYGAKNYESFRSLQGIDLVWVDEGTELSAKAWEVLIPTIRNKGSRFLVAFNPKHETDWVYSNFILKPRPNAQVVKINWNDNPFFNDTELPAEMEYDRSISEALYKHVWEGELLIDNEDALFKESDIYRLGEDEEALIRLSGFDKVFEKIVVAIDPSGTANVNSDACGVMVCGKYIGQDRYCVIEDHTKIMKPDAWAIKAVSLYHSYEANDIIYETNYGGDMVESVLKSKDRSIRPKGVRATKGKLLRAEPIQALYAQNKVDHFSNLGALELEMLTYTGDPKQKSPNRLDALVWGLYWLSGKGRSGTMSAGGSGVSLY